MSVSTLPADHFDALEFDALLASHGTPARWRKARRCPCVDPSSGQPSIVCPFCVVYPGLLWDDGAEIIVLAPGRQRRDVYDQAGMVMEGTITITFPSNVTPAHLDSIELLYAVMLVNNEILERGRVDPLGRSAERVRMPTVLAVESCDAILDGELVQYRSGTDFSVDADGIVSWVGGPPSGTRYSLRYQARPIYVVWSPQSRDEAATKQPYKALAQRLDFFRQRVVGEGAV